MIIEDRLMRIEQRYLELEQAISDPELMERRREEWQKLVREHSELTEVVAGFREYTAVQKERGDVAALLEAETDPDMKELFRQEQDALKEKEETLKEQLIGYLIPKDPDDEKNIILEIRAGAGGDEAALFGAVLMRMYSRFAERRRWKFSVLSSNITDIGGVKEAVCEVLGKGAYAMLKFESGVHRVQRVPATESGGRIHTSTATVAVLPEIDEIDDVTIDPGDIRIDTFRASGHGGQYINMTDSAVRITHMPSGIVVSCQDEKSQLKNKEKAMQVLKSRLLAKMRSDQQNEYTENRRSLIGTGDRSEKIRTYNYPQDRVTDHRIGLTVHSIDSFVDGDMEEVIQALTAFERADQMLHISD